jgi:hypothetical protein
VKQPWRLGPGGSKFVGFFRNKTKKTKGIDKMKPMNLEIEKLEQRIAPGLGVSIGGGVSIGVGVDVEGSGTGSGSGSESHGTGTD